MDSTSRAPVRMEASLFKRGPAGLAILWSTLVVAASLFLAVGFAGPEVFKVTESSRDFPLTVSSAEDAPDAIWTGRLYSMQKLHQVSVNLHGQRARKAHVLSGS